MHGDPTWAGPLAGVALGLPVYHIIEPEIKAQIAPACYEEHLKLMEIALDVDKISQALTKLRSDQQASG
jgi:betaine reductase